MAEGDVAAITILYTMSAMLLMAVPTFYVSSVYEARLRAFQAPACLSQDDSMKKAAGNDCLRYYLRPLIVSLLAFDISRFSHYAINTTAQTSPPCAQTRRLPLKRHACHRATMSLYYAWNAVVFSAKR